MIKYLVQRLISTIPVLFGVSIFVFLIIHLVPGDVVTVMLGTNTDPQVAASLRHQLGLDQPIYIQYFTWLGKALHGNLGTSIRTGDPVTSTIMQRFGPTLELTLFSMLLSVIIAIPIGVIAAVKPNSFGDYAGRTLAMLGVSMPNFWLATMLILFVSLDLRWLPPGGYASLADNPLRHLKTLIMPAISLGVALMAVVVRYTRSSLLEILSQDFITTARAKGLPERTVIYRHALRNAMIPVLTVIGLQMGYLLGGAVVIEQVFARPGIGRLALEAINERDYPMVQGTVLLVALIFLMVNLIVDMLYAVIDPRIRYE